MKYYKIISLILVLYAFKPSFAQNEISLSVGFNNSKYFESFQTPSMISEEYFVDYNSYLFRLEYLETKPNGNKTGIMLEVINKQTYSNVSTYFSHTNGEFQTMDWDQTYLNIHYSFDKQVFATDEVRISIPIRPFIGTNVWNRAKGKELESFNTPVVELDENGFGFNYISLGTTIGVKFEYLINDNLSFLLQPDYELDLFSPIKNHDRTLTRSYILAAGLSYKI